MPGPVADGGNMPRMVTLRIPPLTAVKTPTGQGLHQGMPAPKTPPRPIPMARGVRVGGTDPAIPSPARPATAPFVPMTIRPAPTPQPKAPPPPPQPVAASCDDTAAVAASTTSPRMGFSKRWAGIGLVIVALAAGAAWHVLKQSHAAPIPMDPPPAAVAPVAPPPTTFAPPAPVVPVVEPAPSPLVAPEAVPDPATEITPSPWDLLLGDR